MWKILATITTLVILALGCAGNDGADGQNGTNGTNGNDGTSCQTPPSTYHMMNYKLIATEEFDRWLENAEDSYAGCPENGIADTEEECFDYYLRSKYSAHRWYAVRGNLFPEHECGATVMDIVTTVDEYVAAEGKFITVWNWNSDDTDGDGITNYHEYFMGLNPCYPQSFGCTNDADGDFDFDGIINGEDDHPYCPEVASYWPAECI